MAEVFANGRRSSGDLLQQAFQQVVDDDEPQDNEFMAFLQNSNNSSQQQVIQLTAEQAAALGITFKVTDEQQQNDFNDCQDMDEQNTQTLSQDESQRIINELTQSGLLKPSDNGNTFHDWEQQKYDEHSESFQEPIDSNMPMDIGDLTENDQSIPEEIDVSNILQVQSDKTGELLKKQDISKNTTQCKGNILQNTVQFSIGSSISQVNSITESQAQILQRFPMILPTSQFIIKPAQTVLTPVKNIRILPNTNKTQTSQNSLLLPKTTMMNTISPQIIKAMPIGTQFINASGNISTQMLNNSRIFTKNCDNNQLLSEPMKTVSTVNSVPTFTHHVVHSSSAQKQGQTQIQQKGNLQQFFTPILKSSTNISTTTKTTSLLNTNALKQHATTSNTKSIQYPGQILKSGYVKSPLVVGSTKNTNSPVIFKTTPVLKSDDCRQKTPTTPVSLLKPQAKVVNSNLVKQNLSNSILTQKSPSTKTLDLSDSMKPLVSAKLKQSVNSLMKTIKKKAISQIPVTAKQETIDVNKPLGSSENPIQIVQQGNSFHSMQRLTQSQLKHIIQVLQQRSQETTNPNEKVVYRLVFPEDLDLKKSSSSLLKNRGGKRGRPKKSTIKTPIIPTKPILEEEHDDSKDERKKIIARTRSGRLSRPPRHMVRDYKHLHHLDFTQPEMDDSDGGYSDYNTNNSGAGLSTNKFDDEGHRAELLTGLEVPKRKISDHFRCPTCNKIYLGRTRMTRHFESHPDHGSPDQLPPPSPEPELKTPPQDPLKRKGKKRGPWAYVTPEAKSERRQLKLQEAISVCESSEIAKIAGKPVANSLSLYDILLLKSGNNVRTFLSEIKEFVEKVREKTSTMLSVACNDEKHNDDVVDLNEELLCDILALNSGFYKVNEALSFEEPEIDERTSNETFDLDCSMEPPHKVQKTDSILEEGKENMEERLSSGFSESSDLSVSEFLNERRSDSTLGSVNIPEVLSALTLIPRNNAISPINDISTKVNNVSTVLNSGCEVQTTDNNSGFQKLSINASTKSNTNFMKEGEFTKLGDSLDSGCGNVFAKLNGNYDQVKIENVQQTFIKLEPTEDGFIKLENGMLGSFHQEIEDFGKIQNNGYHYISSGATESFHSNKGFRKLLPKIKTDTDDIDMKVDDDNKCDEIDENSIRITTSSNSNNADSNIFENSDNLDITKITNYDHIAHLDILNGSDGIDKNLMMDEKLVHHLQLVDSSNFVDEIVSERLKSMMPESLLESNLLNGNSNLDTELDFDELSEEFNRNTRS